METRCPNAKMGKKYTLEGYRLTFRGSLPDIIPEENGRVVGGLWEITDADEAALDLYEGYTRHGFSNLYNKHSTTDGIMYYRMASSLEELSEDDEIHDKLLNCYALHLDNQPITNIILNGILSSMIHGLSDFGITEEELRKSLGLLI